MTGRPEKSLRLNWKPPYHLGEIEAGTRFEYKILRDSWQAEAVDAYGDVPANFSCEAWLDSTQHHTVADWKDRYRGRLTREQIHSRVLAGKPRIAGLAAAGATAQSRKGTFRSIVLHDGANVFDPLTSPISGVDWAADEWVNLLSRHGVMPEADRGGRVPSGGLLGRKRVSARLAICPHSSAARPTRSSLTTELPAHMDARYRTLAEPTARVAWRIFARAA